MDVLRIHTRLTEYLKLSAPAISQLVGTELLSEKGATPVFLFSFHCDSSLHTSIVVSRETKIEHWSIGTLETEGLVFLTPAPKPLKDPQLEFELNIPYFTFYLLQSEAKLDAVRPKLLYSTSNLLESRANEELDLSVILMKLDLLKQRGRTKFHLSDLFQLHSQSDDLEFLIPDTFQYEILKEDPTHSSQQFTAHLKALESSNKCGALNVRSVSFPDAWVSLRRVTEPGLRHLIYIQSKRREKLGAKSTPGNQIHESIEVEHDKCKYLPSRHTFVFITDDKMRQDEISESNVIAVTADNHNTFYGKCMSLRKINCI